MSKLYIRALKIDIDTNNGKFGQCIKFERGLNFIKAENTSGKSTLTNAIIYALGAEAMLSTKKGNASLKPVLKNTVDYNHNHFNVIESYVFLELENEMKEPITIKRVIKGTQDTDLITVYYSHLITNPQINEKVNKENFFVNLSGSAQREKGFHTFLEKYLNIKLPLVSTFKGKNVPLYFQTLLPLLFIEQTRGWSEIQATIPRRFGIENINNITFEFLLKLDILENKQKKKNIEKKIEQNKKDWKNVQEHINLIIEGTALYIKDFPSIMIDLKKDDYPKLLVILNEKEESINEYLVQLRENLNLLNKSNMDITPNLNLKIKSLEEKIIILNGNLQKNVLSMVREKNNINNYELKIKDLMRDIENDKDTKTLLRLGGNLNIKVVEQVCPTCKTRLTDSLIEDIYQPMNLDTNINYLKSQLDAFETLLNSTQYKIDKIEIQEVELRESIEHEREVLKSLKKDVVSNGNVSETTIREKIYLENLIKKMDIIKEIFDDNIEELIGISERYSENMGKISELKKSLFSKNDVEKLSEFNHIFQKLLDLYGFQSKTPNEVIISFDNYTYKPYVDGFDITLDSSASDHIRVIWAYSVALLYLIDKFDTNHFGFLLFDEPRQQSMKHASSKELYKTLSKVSVNSKQSIVATSEDDKLFYENTQGIKCNILEFKGKTIVPKSEWLYQE